MFSGAISTLGGNSKAVIYYYGNKDRGANAGEIRSKYAAKHLNIKKYRFEKFK